MRFVMIFVSDLRAKYRDIDDKKIYQGIVTGLMRLRELGAKHPNIHRSENGMYIDAFKHACIRLNSIEAQHTAIQESREREQLEIEAMEKASARGNTAAPIFKLFSEYKAHYARNGSDAPAVDTYKYLLANDLDKFDLDGYQYYVVMFKIPMQEDIYYKDEVVSAVNAHPRLGDRRFHVEIHPAAMEKTSAGSILGKRP